MAAEAPLNEVKIDPSIMNNTTQEVQNGRSLWLKSIMKEVIKETKSNQRLRWPKIPKVPYEVKNENEESYSPMAVSIGPYHYSDRFVKLVEVENLKVHMARQFILDSGKDIEIFYMEVEKMSQIAREFYDKRSTKSFGDEQFNQMMFLDGCFVLQFIHCITRSYEKLEMSDQQVFHVKRDLLLLENQLPFPVLKSLASLRYEKHENHNEMKLIYDFLFLQILQLGEQQVPARALGCLARGSLMFFFLLALSSPFIFRPGYFGLLLGGGILVCEVLALFLRSLLTKRRLASRYNWLQLDQQPAHLLGLLHSIFTCSNQNAKTKQLASASGGDHNHLYYSAKDFQKVGIHLTSCGTSSLMDVNFQSTIFFGMLELPTITIDVSSKSMLLNLIAYETSSAIDRDQLWITSYMRFMGSLINDAEDVKELRSKGVLINYLGPDQQVAELFNHLCSSLEHNTTDYNDVKRQINEQCGSILKKWVAQLQQTYFNSPWSLAAFVAAAVGLALTATQTYYTINPPRKG